MPLIFTLLQNFHLGRQETLLDTLHTLKKKEGLCISTVELEWPSREVWCTMEPRPLTIYLHPCSVKGWYLRNVFLYYSPQSAFAFAFWKRRLSERGLWFILCLLWRDYFLGKNTFLFFCKLLKLSNCKWWSCWHSCRFWSLSVLLAGWETTGYFLQALILDQTFK